MCSRAPPGVNMAASTMTEARVEMSQLNGAHAPMYDTFNPDFSNPVDNQVKFGLK